MNGSPNILSMSLWNVAAAFLKPRGMYKYSKVLNGLIMAVFSMSIGEPLVANNVVHTIPGNIFDGLLLLEHFPSKEYY